MFKSTTMGKFHHSKKHHGDKKKSSSSRLKYSTIWLKLDEGSCQKIFYLLKITRGFRIPSAISLTWNLQRKISARSWTRTRSQELRPPQQFHQCCNSSHKLPERLNRKSQSGRGREDNHSQTSLTQEERHCTSTESRSSQRNSVEQLCSAQAHWCHHQPWYASVPQVGPDQAPRPRDQVQETATVL